MSQHNPEIPSITPPFAAIICHARHFRPSGHIFGFGETIAFVARTSSLPARIKIFINGLQGLKLILRILELHWIVFLENLQRVLSDSVQTMKLVPYKRQGLSSSACLFALCLCLSSVFASGEGWITNFEAAKKQAVTEKKDLLLEFTGSDWCPPCIKLRKDVFAQKSFLTAASAKFVLVELDFPQEKKLDAETSKQNERLEETYQIEGYPTILLCDASGKPYAQTGFHPVSPEEYSAHLEELQEIRVKRDASFAKAELAKENADKATALIEALQMIDVNLIDTHYCDVIEQIAKLDPGDKSGFVKVRKESIAKKMAEAKAETAMKHFAQEKLEPLMKAKEYDKAMIALKAFLKEHPDLSPDTRDSQLFGVGLAAPMEKGDLEGAYAVMDQLVKEYPDSAIAKNIDQVKTSIAEELKAMKNANQKGAE